jgi:hypothetical protein
MASGKIRAILHLTEMEAKQIHGATLERLHHMARLLMDRMVPMDGKRKTIWFTYGLEDRVEVVMDIQPPVLLFAYPALGEKNIWASKGRCQYTIKSDKRIPQNARNGSFNIVQ